MKRSGEAVDGEERWHSRTNCQKRMRCADRGKTYTGSPDATVKTLADERETDPHRLAQRQKQIDYGKNTIGYDRYCALVPRHKRRPGKHPMTPDKTMRVGKKGFDGIVRKWRQALHQYDPPELVEAAKTLAVNAATVATAKATPGDSNTEEIETSHASSSSSIESHEEDKTRMKSFSTPPSHSIYENFDEDKFDDVDTDDDLL
ncbi:hypothetical protein PsorP6_019223 [Peronosclerospora sorghi]|nr:hypothetical protein PsorP6_019223 [Peronosclerospora sorghi]